MSNVRIGLWCSAFLLFFPGNFIYCQTEELAAVEQRRKLGHKSKRRLLREILPGAVVGFWHDGQWLVRDTYGNRQIEPSVQPMTLDTVFDMASITKPVATATSVLILVKHKCASH